MRIRIGESPSTGSSAAGGRFDSFRGHRGVFEELSESDPRAPRSLALALKQRTHLRLRGHDAFLGRVRRAHGSTLSCGRGFARTSKSPAEEPQGFGSRPPAAWPSSLRALAGNSRIGPDRARPPRRRKARLPSVISRNQPMGELGREADPRDHAHGTGVTSAKEPRRASIVLAVSVGGWRPRSYLPPR
jgi:hypothetical protein